jgi:hypothetical protein
MGSSTGGKQPKQPPWVKPVAYGLLNIMRCAVGASCKVRLDKPTLTANRVSQAGTVPQTARRVSCSLRKLKAGAACLIVVCHEQR